MKLLIAEDTRDLNRAISVLLEREQYAVDSAYDGQEALDFIKNESYDGIILDIMMPRVDGLSVLRELRARHILTPVLLLTAKTEVEDRVAGLDAGADDYLPKPFAMKELLARVRAMTRRSAEYSGGELRFGDVSLHPDTFAMTSSNSVRLSIREFELMQALMTNADHSLSTEYLLEHIWKGEPDAQADTVWLYICYLKGKLRSVGSPVSISGGRGGQFQLIMEM
ncbi:MAG: response regulator transcription factor [Clostridia bacterium]|nr:response regulator transcription factor [Clostridia bacterium]